MTNPPTISNDIKLYYEERLRGLGITDQINQITSPVYEGIEGGWKATGETKTFPAFELHEKGIQINYYHPNGHRMTWKKDGNKWPTNYTRIRLQKEATYEKEGEIRTAKYLQEKGSPVFPYITPGIIDKWTKATEIETLVLIEGEFKAFKAWLTKSKCQGMDNVEFMGLPGIHGFYGGDMNHKMEINETIQQVIIDCKVRNIVILLDADTLTVKWKEDKDLSHRPSSFAKAIKNFRNSLHLLLEDKNVDLAQVYFMHIKTKFGEQSKGLDDLLIQVPAKAQAILDDLLNFHFAKSYFDGIILTDGQTSSVDKYFGLTDKETFFQLYREYIGSRPFVFKKIKYEWSGEELKYVKSEEADRFMRVGINWVKKVKTPNHRGLMEEKVEKWSVAEIKRDYPKHIADRMINYDIPRYDTFIIEPCWDPKSYKRVIHGCYNLMEPLMFDPKPGRMDATIQFLKHIFGGEATIEWDEKDECYREYNVKGDQFSIAMDYLTILHQHPKQKTFVPCLVSKEQGTGKTTFLEWLCTVYNGNGTILDNERFKMNFNGHYASKFIIGLDEGFLDVEKKAERERLKKMVTSKTMFLEYKGMDIREIPYYGKLIICSNDADNLMKMEEEDTRWFVVKVPRAKSKDPDLEKKLMEEIPYYLHYIATRKVFHPKVDRLWFDPKDFETEQMRRIIEVTKSRIDAVVENWIKDLFLTYKEPTLRINRKTMLKYLNDPAVSKYKIDEKDLKYFLEDKKGLAYQSPGRCRLPIAITGYDTSNIPKITYFDETQRHYLFRPEEWLKPAEYEEYRRPFEFDKHEKADQAEKEKAVPAGHFEEAEKLTNKQYEIEQLWTDKNGPAPF
jgi:hypothetical protein